MTRIFLILIFLITAPALITAAPIDAVDTCKNSSPNLNLAVNNYGISLGNSRGIRGLRLNFRDECVEEVLGINLTIWKAGKNPDAIFKGLSAGLYGPSAKELHFLSIGGAHIKATSLISGVSVSGGVIESGGKINGLAVSGIATVAESDFCGISLSGLTNVTGGDLRGISLGGLANVTDGSCSGITFGGLANVSGEAVSGISLSGLATIAKESISGISLSGGPIIAGGDIRGISVGIIPGFLSDFSDGIDIEFRGIKAANAKWLTINGISIDIKNDLEGCAVSGIYTTANEIRGLNISGIYTRAGNLRGLSASAVNYYDNLQVGLSVGIVNYSKKLSGVQIGLLNIAGNNPGWARYLPILNAHID